MSEKVVQQVIDTFKFNEPKNPKLIKTVWRIKVDGKIVTLNSGKSVWKRIGDAKNALRNHCESAGYFMFPRWDQSKERDSVYSDLISSGRVEFVSLELE